MNYKEALDYIHNTNKFGMKLGLENMKNLLNNLGNPQDNLKFIHIAGTNGKGSSSIMLHSILKTQGYRVGLFTSPYLEEFTERMQINGVHIKSQELGDLTKRVKDAIEDMVSKGFQHPTEFEIVTAIGMLYFELNKVDVVILEVGLGGRLDATNIITSSEVSIITAIGKDHTAQLGNSLEKIATEKAGIIKHNGRVVIYPQPYQVEEVIRKIAIKKDADIYLVKKDSINIIESSLGGQAFSYQSKHLTLAKVEMSLLGQHQIYNAATILKAIEVLNQRSFNISQDSIIMGLKNINWPGRFEIIHRKPLIILDGAHNAHGAEAFCKTIKEYISQGKINLVLGILEDKDVDEMLKYFLAIAKEVITITPNNPRAMAAQSLAEKIKSLDPKIKISSMASIEEAVEWSKKCSQEEVIAFTGSLYVIGDVKSFWGR